MSARSYKLIFALLSGCILFIIGLQGYWIRNFYLQKEEELERNVYSALDQLNTKLQDRKNLQSLKMTYIIQNGDTIAKTPSHKISIITEKENKTEITQSQKTNVISANVGKNKIQNRSDHPAIIDKHGKAININLGGTSSTLVTKAEISSVRILSNDSVKSLIDTLEMKKFVDKMMQEIKVIDLDQEDDDTLHGLIKNALVNKGIFLHFEFSMQNLKSKKIILAQSKGFSKRFKTYKRDLSSNRVIYTGEFLLLQFPGRDAFLMSNMKTSLLLALAFSLIIITVFYYVIRIILAQKKLSEIKNDFVNNMTHELKTPIATISLALDAISNPLVKNDEEKFNDYTRILKEENKKLNKHVESVLQIALLDKGELHLDKEQLNINVIIFSALKDQHLQLIEKNAKVETTVPAELFMHADEGHMKAVFANLINNALKYSPEKSEIKISAQKENNKTFIRIKDNGIGIDAENQKKIFEKFYRVQGGNLHDVKGFGLGLSYVKSIVEAHGGSVEVKSELGKGSEFLIVLGS